MSPKSGSGGSDGGPERRRKERVPARIEVRFQKSAAAAMAFRAYSLNFSIGGLCLRTRNLYPIGTWLRLFLKIESQEYEMTGVVAWERRGAIGVRFEKLDPADLQRLASLVAALKVTAD